MICVHTDPSVVVTAKDAYMDCIAPSTHASKVVFRYVLSYSGRSDMGGRTVEADCSWDCRPSKHTLQISTKRSHCRHQATEPQLHNISCIKHIQPSENKDGISSLSK